MSEVACDDESRQGPAELAHLLENAAEMASHAWAINAPAVAAEHINAIERLVNSTPMSDDHKLRAALAGFFEAYRSSAPPNMADVDAAFFRAIRAAAVYSRRLSRAGRKQNTRARRLPVAIGLAITCAATVAAWFTFRHPPYDRLYGGGGGVEQKIACKKNQSPRGLEAGTEGRWISGIALNCGGAIASSPIGRLGAPKKLRCKKGDRLVGIWGSHGRYISNIGPVCAGRTGRYRMTAIGRPAIDRFFVECPANSSVTGLRGRGALLVDAIGLVCR